MKLFIFLVCLITFQNSFTADASDVRPASSGRFASVSPEESARIIVKGWNHPNGRPVQIALEKQCEDPDSVKPRKPRTIAEALNDEPVLFLMGALVRRQGGSGTREFVRLPNHIRPNRGLQNYAILRFEQGFGSDITITNITESVKVQWAKVGIKYDKNPETLRRWALGLQIAQRVYELGLVE